MYLLALLGLAIALLAWGCQEDATITDPPTQSDGSRAQETVPPDTAPPAPDGSGIVVDPAWGQAYELLLPDLRGAFNSHAALHRDLLAMGASRTRALEQQVDDVRQLAVALQAQADSQLPESGEHLEELNADLAQMFALLLAAYDDYEQGLGLAGFTGVVAGDAKYFEAQALAASVADRYRELYVLMPNHAADWLRALNSLRPDLRSLSQEIRALTDLLVDEGASEPARMQAELARAQLRWVADRVVYELPAIDDPAFLTVSEATEAAFDQLRRSFDEIVSGLEASDTGLVKAGLVDLRAGQLALESAQQDAAAALGVVIQRSESRG